MLKLTPYPECFRDIKIVVIGFLGVTTELLPSNPRIFFHVGGSFGLNVGGLSQTQ